MVGSELKLDRQLKNSSALCELCQSFQATRRMRIEVDGEQFETYTICDSDECYRRLEELI